MAQQQPQRGSGRPGAMTMAMAAVKTASGPKVLRIGVIQGTKMTEERIVRNRDTVSVGTTEKNTFTIAAPEFPAHFDLFPMIGGSYALNFTDTMEGRLALPQGVKTLDELKRSGIAKRSNIGWQVPLSEQSRGKVQIGDITFLFQFVVAPPPQPKPQLPAAIRAGWVKNIDWTYNACFAFFLVFAIAGIAYVEYIYDPIVDDEYSVDDDRIVRLLAQPPAPEEPPPPEQNTNQPTDPGNQGQQQAAAAGHAEHHANAAANAAAAQGRAERAAANATAAANRAVDAALSALNNSAEFAALTGATDTGHGSARDALASGGLMAGTERDLANLGGISTSAGGSGLRRGGLAASAGGGLGGGQLGASHTVSSGGGDIGSGGEIVRERVIRGDASLGSGDSIGGEGNIDAGRVAGIIRGQLGGIRSCYERALRNNPTLSGRLELRFTIGSSGRVTNASASGLSAAPDVGSCVVSRIRGLVFPPPEGGSVDFSFPFTFAPGGG